MTNSNILKNSVKNCKYMKCAIQFKKEEKENNEKYDLEFCQKMIDDIEIVLPSLFKDHNVPERKTYCISQQKNASVFVYILFDIDSFPVRTNKLNKCFHNLKEKYQCSIEFESFGKNAMLLDIINTIENNGKLLIFPKLKTQKQSSLKIQ